ncbi:MAG: DUF4142 domain-containing protein [Silvibacterium sp.]
MKHAAMLAAVLVCGSLLRLLAAPANGKTLTASAADKTFLSNVSQGGLYEVEAGEVAAERGKYLAVKDFGALDAHDHDGVNAQLKHIADATGEKIEPGLNAQFTARLVKLKAVPDDQFDSYYIEDMKDIHNKDEALFVKEAQDGSGPYKEFAKEAGILVRAHLGWLNTI